MFASAWPDGLEKVAEDTGFIDLAEQIRISIPTPYADYTFNENEGIGTSMAGILGSLVEVAAVYNNCNWGSFSKIECLVLVVWLWNNSALLGCFIARTNS